MQWMTGAGLDVAANQVMVPTQYWLGATLAYTVGKVLTTTGLSRSHERQADLYAAYRLPLAGLKPESLSEALLMITLSQGNSTVGWLSTHPANSERIRTIKAVESSFEIAKDATVPYDPPVQLSGKRTKYCPIGPKHFNSIKDEECPQHHVALE